MDTKKALEALRHLVEADPALGPSFATARERARSALAALEAALSAPESGAGAGTGHDRPCR